MVYNSGSCFVIIFQLQACMANLLYGTATLCLYSYIQQTHDTFTILAAGCELWSQYSQNKNTSLVDNDTIVEKNICHYVLTIYTFNQCFVLYIDTTLCAKHVVNIVHYDTVIMFW